jgi:hypothetical protein
MSTDSDISQRVAQESARRVRLGVPVVASGVLYLFSAITISAILRGAPSVGVLQGLGPALRGEANPTVSPRAAEIKFESHQAFGLIAGSLLASVAIVVLALALLFLFGAVRFRRPLTKGTARPLILVGGVLIAVLTVLNEIVLAIRRHSFATGHNFTTHAVNAITHNVGYDILAIVTPLAGIAFVAGMIMTVVAAVRVGLLPRWMGMVGGVSAVLLLLPAAELDVIPAFWMVATGILLMGKWPKGDPPAWPEGASCPWPSQAAVRGERGQGNSAGGWRSRSQSSSEIAPEPAMPTSTQSGKRRRKRGSRR